MSEKKPSEWRPEIAQDGKGAVSEGLMRLYLAVIAESPRDTEQKVDYEAYAQHALTVMTSSMVELEAHLKRADVWSSEQADMTRAVIDEIARRMKAG